MNLQQQQTDFLACLHASGPLPTHHRHAALARGLAVYRNNYRQTLLTAMRSTFERSARWVGDEAFAAAAAHHLILHPPASWTLDAVGDGFAQTVAGLFARDPEVADLVALEWAMHRVFTAADSAVLDRAGFAAATASFGDADWAAMQLRFQPGVTVFASHSDCVSLWAALADDERPPDPPALDRPGAVMGWREHGQPDCRLVPAEEAQAVNHTQAGSG